MEILINRVVKALELTWDYYHFIPENSLSYKIPDAPSNCLGEQAWCIIGARESYLKALEVGLWSGFSCSLENHLDKSEVINKLEDTATNLDRFLHQADSRSLNMGLVFDLLEHEVQHHGQLIRFAYANKLGFPKSWNNRYTV